MFQKKTSKGTSLDFYQQDKGKAIQLSSGLSPVNPDGSTYDNSVQLDWPYSPATPDEVINPRPNPKVPPYLDNNGRNSTGSNKVSPTLG